MIPLVGIRTRLAILRSRSRGASDEGGHGSEGRRGPVPVGTMIELPRACARRRQDRRGGRVLLVRHQRPHADGVRLLPRRHRGQVPAHLHREADLRGAVRSRSIEQGVGQLVEIGVQSGRMTRPDLEIGICGEHGGDPRVHRLLPPRRARLRELLAAARAHRAARRGPGAGPARSSIRAATPPSRSRSRSMMAPLGRAGPLGRLDRRVRGRRAAR
jgi:hypothetical protein